MLTTIDRYIVVREVDDGKALADPIFARRYGTAAPDFPHHVLAFCRDAQGMETPVCYIHFTEMGDFLLGGGACVDDRVMRRMQPEARSAIRKVGGLYRYSLSWSLGHFSPSCSAIFGYCGDALAERIDLAVGFQRTVHPHLLVYFTRKVEAADRERMTDQAHAVGPF